MAPAAMRLGILEHGGGIMTFSGKPLTGLMPWTVVDPPDLTRETGPGDFRALDGHAGKHPSSLVQKILERFPSLPDVPREHPGLKGDIRLVGQMPSHAELMIIDREFHERARATTILRDIQEKIAARFLTEELLEARQDQRVITADVKTRSAVFAHSYERMLAATARLDAVRILSLDQTTLRQAIRLHLRDLASDNRELTISRQIGMKLMHGEFVPVSKWSMTPLEEATMKAAIARLDPGRLTKIKAAAELRRLIAAQEHAGSMALQAQPNSVSGAAMRADAVHSAGANTSTAATAAANMVAIEPAAASRSGHGSKKSA